MTLLSSQCTQQLLLPVQKKQRSAREEKTALFGVKRKTKYYIGLTRSKGRQHRSARKLDMTAVNDVFDNLSWQETYGVTTRYIYDASMQ